MTDAANIGRIPRSLRTTRPSGKDKCAQEGHCRMCLRHRSIRPLTRHHVVPMRWWKWAPEPRLWLRNASANIIPLCRPCHDLVEEPDREVRDEARRMCRRAMTQQEITFAIACRGAEWFNHQYPT